MNRALSFVMVIAVLLALLLGASMCGNVRETAQQLDWATGEQRAARAAIENAARQEQLRIQTARERNIAEIDTAAGIVLRVIGVGLLGVLGVIGIYALWNTAALSFDTWRRWANTFYPDEAGVFPLIKLRVSGRWIVHDANRAMTATTVYNPVDKFDTVNVVQVLPSGLESAQIQTSWNAQRVQALAAANRPQPALATQPTTRRGETAAEQVTTPETIEHELALPPQVSLANLLRGTASLNHLVIGAIVRDNNIEPLTASLYDLMHVLAVGASGWGKSTWLRSLLYQIALAQEACEVIAIDTAGSAFNALSGWGKLRYPVARTTDQAISQLNEVSTEIERRKELYRQYPTVENLPEYNRHAKQLLAPWIVAIDEGTNMLNQDGISEPLRAGVQTARQYGIYYLLSGQSAKARVVDTQIRDNFSTKICFRTSPSSSRVVIDDSAANELREKGRAWVQLPGRELTQMQGAWIDKQSFIGALSNGGARHPQPEPVKPEPDERAQKILNMWGQEGMSITAIANEIYGSHGGQQNRLIQKVIDQWG